MTIAYQSDSSGFVSLLGYAIILYGFLSDVIFFNEKILALQFVGALIIFVATFIVAVIKLCEQHRQRKKQQTQVKTSTAAATDGEAAAEVGNVAERLETEAPIMNGEGDAPADKELNSPRDRRQIQR